MITVLFKLIILTSIWVLAIKIATAKGMFAEGLGDWCSEGASEGKKIFEPLCDCPYCMPSVHSVVGFGFGYLLGVWNSFEWRLIVLYVLTVFGSSIVSGFLWSTHDLIININKYFKNLNDENEAYNKKQDSPPTEHY